MSSVGIRVAALVCQGDCLASRDFVEPARRRAIADALAENASVVLSVGPPTPDDARARGLTQDDDRTQYANLVQRRAYRGAKLSKAFFDLASPSLSAHLPWPWIPPSEPHFTTST